MRLFDNSCAVAVALINSMHWRTSYDGSLFCSLAAVLSAQNQSAVSSMSGDSTSYQSLRKERDRVLATVWSAQTSVSIKPVHSSDMHSLLHILMPVARPEPLIFAKSLTYTWAAQNNNTSHVCSTSRFQVPDTWVMYITHNYRCKLCSRGRLSLHFLCLQVM